MRHIGARMAAIVALMLASCDSEIRAPVETAVPTVIPRDGRLVGWETPSEEIPLRDESCVAINAALIEEVPGSHRSIAIWRLREESLVSLSDDLAARLLDVPVGENSSLAASLLQRHISQLRERKRLQLEERIGGWSLADDDDLNSSETQLTEVDSRPPRPFLIRAVSKFDQTGGLYAYSCDNSLHIHHSSLGSFVPPSRPLPAVVFLPSPPDRVYVSWGIVD